MNERQKRDKAGRPGRYRHCCRGRLAVKKRANEVMALERSLDGCIASMTRATEADSCPKLGPGLGSIRRDKYPYA